MKRKLWIILAFLVVLASLCFGAAQAAGTYTSTPVSMRFSFFQWDETFYPTQYPEVTWEDRAPDIGEGIMPFQIMGSPAYRDPECTESYCYQNDNWDPDDENSEYWIYYVPELGPGQCFYVDLCYITYTRYSIDLSKLNLNNVTVFGNEDYAIEPLSVSSDTINDWLIFGAKCKVTKVSPQVQQNWEILLVPGEGGSGSMNKLSVPNGTQITVPECTLTPPDSSYAFYRWRDAYASPAMYYQPGDHMTVTGHKTLVAEWVKMPDCLVIFDYGTGYGTEFNNMPYGSELTLPDCTYVYCINVFKNWRIGDTAYQPGDKITVTENLTVLAEWTYYYTVSFDTRGHGAAPAQQHIASGSSAKQPDNPTMNGFIFGGWYTDTDFAPAHKYHFTEPVTTNLTLYAWWGHTVDFDPNGMGPNNFPVSRKEVHEGSPVAMPDVYTLRTDSDTWQGWYIEGWYRESECVNRFNFAQPVTANIRLYAHWLYDGYTVTYNWNGIHNVTRWRPADGTYSDIEPDTPVELKTRTGQPFRQIVPLRFTGSGNPGSIDFTGWYTEPECVNPYDFSAAATGDTTLYAGWANNYTVTRHYTNPYGGMVSTFTYIIPYNCVPSDDGFLSYALEDPPHYNGWVAAGYFTNEALTVPFDPDVPLTADVDIYIKWEKASYTVTFDMNGGNEENIIQTYAYGDAIIPPTTRPTRTEYVFEGWSPYANATYTYGFANTTCTGDATYYAVWVPEGIAINAANFPDEVFRHYVLQNIAKEGHTDANGTHYLSASERDDVITLDLRYYTYNGQKISNLQGIQYFTKLETLICQNHNLTALDLSHNTELKTLECQENQITSLNLNNNTKLTTLNARDNALTTVNAVKCTELTGTVYLYNNPDLTSVQLSAPGIRVLELQFTGVTEIDLSGCPNLCLAISNGQVTTVGNEPNTYERHLIHLNNVNYIVYLSHGTPLNGFITSGIPIDEAHFPDAAFREFMGRINFDRNQNGVLTDNEISEITVLSTTWAGIVTGMHSLQGIEYLTSVAEIMLDGSGLDEVDLSQNQHLYFVSMKNNDLRNVDVSALSGLTGLDLSNNPGLHTITTGSVQIETLRAPGAPLLTGLDLSGQLRLLKTYLSRSRLPPARIRWK